MVISDCPTSSNSANPISWCMYACGGTPLRFTRRFFLRQTLLYLRLGLLIFTATCVSAQGPFPDSFNPSASNGTVIAVAEQLDGRILVGGGFNSLGGQLRNRIGRIEADGTLDKGFDPNALPTFLRAVAVQTDGAIIVGGDFTTLSGQLRNRVGRINENGTLDTSFNPGANSNVFAMSLQSDGKILIGGAFTAVGGQARLRLARLNFDGTLDVGFDPAPNGLVEAVTIQSDGKILIGGAFTSVGGKPRTRIARLNTDGSVDVGFNPGAGNTVNCVAVQADGKVLVGGTFGSLGGQVRNYLGRVNSDGTIDTGFNPGANNVVNTLAVQVDGKIVIGGNFSNLGGQSRSCLGRLNADGTIDSGFNPGASAFVFALALQADGKLLVGGNFSTLGGQLRKRVGRLNSTGVTTQSLSVVGSTLTWLRSGSLPEIWQATFDYSPDGRNWTNMGAGVRIPGGWQLSIPSNPGFGSFRARGSVAVADSSYFVADYFGMAALISQPLDRTNNAGTTSRFSVLARSTGQLGYQWLKNGTVLLDGGNVSGANSRELVLSNVLAADFGDYSVAVSNSFGVVTSRVAQLSVIDPVIVGYTSEQLRQGGQDVTLSVNAAGTAPMSYYWLKGGAPTDGAAGSSLSLTNLQGADAGGYQVIVSNLYGSVTSVVSWLSVNLASVDAGFNAGVVGTVESISVQTDGKTLVAGDFQLIDSQHRYFVRLDRAGATDFPFNANANGRGTIVALQADGQILAGGFFDILGSQALSKFGRLKPNGELDTQLDLKFRYNGYPPAALALQADGKILFSGGFTNLNGQPATNFARLNFNGTVDESFALQIDWLPDFSALAVQPDGKILVGGYIYQLSGLSRPYLARLNPSGSVDTNFTANINYDVRHIVVQPDGKVLIAGGFTRVDGLSRTNLARLNPDGSLDQQFTPPGFSDVRSMALQADGKILVAAPFVLSDKQSRKHLVRLKTDGTIDGTFSPEVGAVAILNSVAIMDDGHVLIGGRFSTINGLPRNNLARLNPSEPSIHHLSVEGDTITWQFGGSAPQLAWAYFEHSMNGVIWNRVGSASPISDSWQLSGASIPNSGTLRARGYVASSDAAYFIEDFYGPMIIQQPSSRTNNAGSVASFAVTASGPELTNYQWLKNGIPVVNGPNLDGATGSVLTLSNVLKNDDGTYSVHVTNFEGSLTSMVARLTVIDPFISMHPRSQTHERGGSATLSIAATGTEPLSCQWWHNRAPVSGATGFDLSLTNLENGGDGDYFAVVSNSFGSVTSSTAVVTVNLTLPDERFAPGTVPFVHSLAPQRDGKVLVGGLFSNLGGLPFQNFARLLPNGSGDAGFSPGLAGDVFRVSPYASAIHMDGYILVSGLFVRPFGQVGQRLERLREDGVVDSNFEMYVGVTSATTVNCMAIQADGKVVIGGLFTSVDGQPRTHLARLNRDGTLDDTFVPLVQSDRNVTSIAVQPDGRILVAGRFERLGGQARFLFGRLNADGSLDETFNVALNSYVYSMAVQADGKILLGGSFVRVNGQNRTNIVRLNADGALDLDFKGNANGDVYSIVCQTDGKLLVGGQFTTLSGQSRNLVGRLNPDGEADTTFDVRLVIQGVSNPTVMALAMQADGSILIGGDFSTGGDNPRMGIARLNNTSPPSQKLNYDGTNIVWRRSGSLPEIWHVFFERSSDGTNWTYLGQATRITGGWQRTEISIPSGSAIRARGLVAACDSAWFVESIWPEAAPRLVIHGSFLDPVDGKLELDVLGSRGSTSVIDGSTDFQHWTPIVTNIFGTGPLFRIDGSSTNGHSRFFRARLVQ